MYLLFKKPLLALVATLAMTCIALPTSSKAQTYPIDCAILLCLSGGWPASVPCSLARAEFIRRITPWPVEPPLQIWRCPMGASYEMSRQPRRPERFFDILFQGRAVPPRQSLSRIGGAFDAARETGKWPTGEVVDGIVLADLALRYVQTRADIDISGNEFNFVRSIRVFHVRFASQKEAG